MRTLGICLGATSLQCVRLWFRDGEPLVVAQERIAHEGNPGRAILEYLGKASAEPVSHMAATGRGFRSRLRLATLSEPEAIEFALRKTYAPDALPDLVVSAGGESQLVYRIGPDGSIASVHTGNKCASGTGEFFLQQVRRMGLTLSEAGQMAQTGEPHRIAGRCSVFCKSDCTHALNKGEKRENITAGLCVMMVDKIMDLIKDMDYHKLCLVGGGSLNPALVALLRKRVPVLDIPRTAACFEAYGAALWAYHKNCGGLQTPLDQLVHNHDRSFTSHPPLSRALPLVEFRQPVRDTVRPGDVCVLGLDVGSTTTKAVLVHRNTRKMLASVYLKTNGDPVRASRECYRSLRGQVGASEIVIEGLGVTGSGRQIAGLHALTDNVINEIVAHAAATAHFDPTADTLFEIGGQDAKYTLLTAGVPSDYAMNEACSAGTGSFLEESALESLGVPTEQIGPLALEACNPPNFSDQCAAFISSDIKRAGQEGLEKTDILAGLVYSVCLNYLNRVKGSRPIGQRIFMQGGVCYNQAVPLAMAALLKARITVPPDPGLMGAFGVALEVIDRLVAGQDPVRYELDELIQRQAVSEGSFVCGGGKEHCDRKCEIAKIRVQGKSYAFGGACNRYYNMRLKKEVDVRGLDLVALRQHLLFTKYAPRSMGPQNSGKPAKTLGLPRSFLANSVFPLYANFFAHSGFRVVLSDSIDPEGIARIEAPFCLPAEVGHGSFLNLLKKKLDYIFLPQVMELPVANVPTYRRTCVFVQAEPYYLQTTFQKEIESSGTVLLCPVLRMGESYEAAAGKLIPLAVSMGADERKAKAAFRHACRRQQAFEQELLEIGKRALETLRSRPETFGIVLFGRPYNAFAQEINMGIPHKVASRGFLILPHDMLPVAKYPTHPKMFWAMGQKMMKAAQFVKESPNLFGVYITNFSCGPDSFLLGFFRKVMQSKPSLTLELDQHTADAGIDTRIEAALDIMRASLGRPKSRAGAPFRPARVLDGLPIRVATSAGEELPLTDPRVEVILPTMGEHATRLVASIFRSIGVRAKALPVAGEAELLEGRKNTTGKECLPYIVTTGCFWRYIKNERDPRNATLLFLPTGGGPCRLGQYCVALGDLVEKHEIPNVAVFTMTDENGYGGLGSRNLLKAWHAVVVSDVLEDIRSMLAVCAADKAAARAELDRIWVDLENLFESPARIRF